MMTQVNMNVALAIISQVFTGDETVNVCGIYRGAMAIGILVRARQCVRIPWRDGLILLVGPGPERVHV